MTIKSIKEDWATIKNKIAVVIMSFKGDDSCLKQCLRGLEEQKKKGYDLEIHILDDANTPLNPDDYKGYHYRKTFFPRNKNLNGVACTLGMLMEMLRIARETRAEYILKVDSDMFIRSLDRFLKPIKEDRNLVLGFKLNPQMNYVAGVTYLLPTIGLYNAIRGFNDWFKNESENEDSFIKHCPEDWAITRCVAETNNFPLVQWDNSEKPQNWLMCPFNFLEVENLEEINPLSFCKCAMYDFVNFGNRYEITEDTKIGEYLNEMDSREIAGYLMEKFIDFDLLNQF